MIGKRLKELRGKRTQQAIADILGVSRASYSHYENDHVQPDNETLAKLAALYKVTTDEILGIAEIGEMKVGTEADEKRKKGKEILDNIKDDRLDNTLFLLEQLNKE